MVSLPNGCRRSNFTVFPKNWQDKKDVDLSRDWYITYRFYDPTRSKPKQVMIKGMNYEKKLKDRQASMNKTLKLVEEELKQGFNPFTDKIEEEIGKDYPIEPSTPLILALQAALARISVEPKTRVDIQGMVNCVGKAAAQLGLDMVAVKDTRRRHIKLILERCAVLQKKFSNNTFNHYRKYLRVLFKELVEVEAVEANIVGEISRKEYQTKQREVLTDEQRTLINTYLQENYPAFHRFLHIFFHSGARITELMKLQVKDVDLAKQTYTSLIIKGKRKRMAIRTIKNIALQFWLEQLNGAHPEDYVFSRGLVPGKQKIQSYQITKRWHRLVKEKFDITADFYSLKHLNTTEVVEQLGEKAAAQLNEHTSTAMVVKIYDVKRKSREHEKIKKVNNPFVK